jgi:hypothetical protein
MPGALDRHVGGIVHASKPGMKAGPGTWIVKVSLTWSG